MTSFPIDEQTDAIFQVAYTVPNLEAALAEWIDKLGVGPWFVLDRIGGPVTTYRGSPGEAEFTVAMAYSGPMLFELIQVLDDKPSVYKEACDRDGYGFHHFAKLRSDPRQDAINGEAKGQKIVFHSPTPGGGEVFFVESGDGLPGYIEFVKDIPATRGVFDKVWRASVDWNGDRPIRNFTELLE